MANKAVLKHFKCLTKIYVFMLISAKNRIIEHYGGYFKIKGKNYANDNF